jgi:hypothetical protein
MRGLTGECCFVPTKTLEYHTIEIDQSLETERKIPP